MLTGSELKAKITSLGQVDEATAATECGYVSPEGKVKMTAFKNAVLEANGLAFAKPAKAKGKGKPLSFCVTASKSGSVVLAGGYGALLGIEPGGKVNIQHDPFDGGALVLTKA